MRVKLTTPLQRGLENVDLYLWVLHPVAYLSNWFLMMPSIATKFQIFKVKIPMYNI
jgi:hypothetical protein